MASVTLDQVSRTFGRGRRSVPAVARVIQHVDDQYVVIVGPSGCGKTTLLRLIAGLEMPDAGVIRIAGRDVRDVPPRGRDVAMVFQNDALYPHMTVAKNISFPLRVRRLPRLEIELNVLALAQRLGLAELLHRRPRELSGGQRQRVALARAVIRKPGVLLLDEPLGHLDAGERLRTRGLLREMHEHIGGTTLHVTHDQEEAMALADRLIVMRDGRIHQAGPPMELHDRPCDRFVAGFLGATPMNFVAGRIETDGDGIAFTGGGVRVGLARTRYPSLRAGTEVVLGFRAEDARVAEPAPNGQDRFAAVVARRELVNGRPYVRVRTSADVELLLEAPRGVAAGSDDHPRAEGTLQSARPGASSSGGPTSELQPGHAVTAHLPPWAIHLFEAGRDGRNLALNTSTTAD